MGPKDIREEKAAKVQMEQLVKGSMLLLLRIQVSGPEKESVGRNVIKEAVRENTMEAVLTITTKNE